MCLKKQWTIPVGNAIDIMLPRSTDDENVNLPFWRGKMEP